MGYEDLHEYMEFLEKNKDLVRIDDPVDPDLELTYLLSEEERIGKGRALLFNKVQGSDSPCVGNLFSTTEKMNAVLGGDPLEIGARLRNLVRVPDNTESMISRGMEMLRELGGIRPKVSSGFGSSHNSLEKVDLNRYPIPRTWPQDAGRYITMPLVITRDPVTGQSNVGMYRMQVMDSETTGMHWQIHKGGAEHGRESRERKEPMDVAVVLGSDPLSIFSAVAPLPDGIDEFSFRGLLAKKRFELVRGDTVNLV